MKDPELWDVYGHATGSASARTTDPATSHEAARLIEGSGKAARQRAELLAAVRKQPGLTAAEYAEILGMERHVPSRRLPELRTVELIDNGPARKCRVQGTQAMTWAVKR